MSAPSAASKSRTPTDRAAEFSVHQLSSRPAAMGIMPGPEMEAVVFTGLQGAGKTTLYQQRFARTHLRISLDQLKTRFREMAALKAALDQGQNVVIDNTNATVAERKRFLEVLKPAGCRVLSYFFELDIAGSLKRNAVRTGKDRVPPVGLFATRKRLQVPTLEEGFDALFVVRTLEDGGFEIVPGIGPAPASDEAASAATP